MTTPTKVHCFFEQSGTFKNEFRKLGIPAEDYDIQNNFGETDHVIDLFAEIERGYDGKPSVFDSIGGGDLIMAFFPCIYFCSMSQMNMRGDTPSVQSLSPRRRCEIILNLHNKRNEFYALLRKFSCVVLERKLQTIIENGYSGSYLREAFIKPSLVDYDRTNRGDLYVKPTAFWFFNCNPTRCCSFEKKNKNHIVIRQYTSKEKKRGLMSEYAKGSGKVGVCSEERSMISPDYARNFIADFILGRPLGGRPQQQDLFAEVQS